MRPDNGQQTILQQNRFDGGVNMLAPGPEQLADAENIVIRDGTATTRPGIRRYLAADSGFIAGFWFNQDNAKLNDATHTGFWFPFNFVSLPLGQTIQGCALTRLSVQNENKVIFAVAGRVYQYERGYLIEIPCSPGIGSTETLEFVQANDLVYMFRSGGNAPMYWDGTEAGFIPVPAAVVGDDIPHGDVAEYHQGRMWVRVDDTLYASALLDFTEYDLVDRTWTIEGGKGVQGVVPFPFHEDMLLAFKQSSVSVVMGITTAIPSGGTMGANVSVQAVDADTGCVARHAVVSVGEDVWYLGYGGIYSFSRNQQNKLELDPVALTTPLQPYIERINWPAVGCACATTHENYVLFAVPVDGSTTNNLVLVFDRLAGGGAGAWLGVWKAGTLNPVRFFHDGEKLLFLSVDGFVRQMFTDDPFDSENALEDTAAYSATEIVGIGCLRRAGSRIYRSLLPSKGVAVTDADYWEAIEYAADAYNVESMILTRPYNLEPGASPLLLGRGEIIVRHQRPKITLSRMSRDYGTEKVLIEDQEYDRRKWDIAGVADWDPTNVNLDAADPHRKDYSLLIPGANDIIVNGGFLTDSDWANVAPHNYWSFGGGRATLAGFGGMAQTLTLIPGETYHLEFDLLYVWTAIACSLNIFLGGGVPTDPLVDQSSLPGRYAYDIVAEASDSLLQFYAVVAAVGFNPPYADIVLSNVTLSGPGVALNLGGIYADKNGVKAEVWETHSLRFLPMMVGDRWIGLRVRNTQGKVKIQSVVMLAGVKRFAGSGIV